MFRDFQSLNLFEISTAEIIINIMVAFLCGQFITWVYRKTYKGAGYSMSYVNSIVLLSMITALVIMVIGNNLARAFGLVGAMSIIRFRTAVKDTIDIVYIFFGLAVGMAAGVGYHRIAILGTLIVSGVLFFYARFPIAGTVQKEYLLQFTYTGEEDKPAYLNVIAQFCQKNRIVNLKSVGPEENLELSYFIRLKKSEEGDQFIKQLSRSEGVAYANLFYDEQQF